MAKLMLTITLLLVAVVPAGAEIITVIEGWTVVYHVTGEPTTQFYGDGTYLFMSTGISACWTESPCRRGSQDHVPC